MSREYQSILFRNLDISIEGYRILRLILNRHTPLVGRVSQHEHDNFHECLVYLKGRGHQLFQNREIAVRRGSLIFIPKNMRHGFRKERELRPLCLVIHFESETATSDWNISSHLNPAALKRLEQGLVRLGQLQDLGADSLSIAGTILDLIGILREAATGTGNSESVGPLAVRVWREIRAAGLDLISANDITKQLGFSGMTELNRQLRAEGSSTVSRILSAKKLARATSRLRETSEPIGEIAEQVGFLDQNYFARWFKAQTGQTPTEFRRSATILRRKMVL